MEIYNFYRMVTSILTFVESGVNESLIPLYGCVFGAILFAIVFVLQGIGIHTMAKKRNIPNRWLAFVPFVNLWYIGKLAGDCQFFGQRMKRGGLYAMLGQIVATVATCAMIAAETYLWMNHGAPKFENMAYWTGLSGFSLAVSQFYDISAYITSIFQLISEVLFFVLLTSLYKQYEPKHYFGLSLLTLLVPISRFFIVFALRNRKAIDYKAYVRAQQEAYARRRQQQYNPYNNPYGNPYQNPYNNPNNPYGQNNAQQSKSDDPFAEFSSSSNGRSTSHTDGDSDGFFD